ncbi:unnamed protein product [Adineta steineri]|uniref:Uncharacterized protein n=1 Tax=Adineta steineri TaxID=433720 RepID=A0A815QT53_9BILA|nr:unnamed protein product [Adineta steineri]
MNAICENSYYDICSCKKKYHLPLTLPLYDGHCHVDLFFKYGLNKNDFNMQLAHAAELQIPVVLHGRGENSFLKIFNELKEHLKPNHNIHWHCVNPHSDLHIITNFLNYFENGYIGLNGSIILKHDKDLQKLFNKWLIDQPNIIDRIILETDYPFLRPPELEPNQYNIITGTTITAQYIVNIFRSKHLNTTNLIDKSNNNIRKMYLID